MRKDADTGNADTAETAPSANNSMPRDVRSARFLGSLASNESRIPFTRRIRVSSAKRIVTKPTLLVEVVFLAPSDGARQVPSVVWGAPHYRPHLVVQDRGVRHARVLPGNVSDEDYLGCPLSKAPKGSISVSR